MDKRVAAIAAVLLLSGCATPPPPAPPTPAVYTGPMRVLTSAEKKAISDVVRGQLKDPNSAMFKWPQIRADRPATAPSFYCAWVNSKNSFGGYVGDKAFGVYISKPEKQLIVTTVGMDGSSEFGQIGMLTRCERAGLQMTPATP